MDINLKDIEKASEIALKEVIKKKIEEWMLIQFKPAINEAVEEVHKNLNCMADKHSDMLCHRGIVVRFKYNDEPVKEIK